MALRNQPNFQEHPKLLYIFIFVLLIIQQIQCVHAQDSQKEQQQQTQQQLQQQQQPVDINKNNAKNESNMPNNTKKKELKVDQTMVMESIAKQQEQVAVPNDVDHQQSKGQVIQIDEKNVKETEQQVAKDTKTNEVDESSKQNGPQQKETNVSSLKSTEASNANAAKNTKSTPSSSMSFHNHQEETIFGAEENISDSLRAGFYFFLALSSSAVLFIVFKIYR